MDLIEATFSKKRSPLSLFLFISILFLTACGVQQGGSWPAISSEGDQAFVAYETQVLAVDVPSNSIAWQYTGSGATRFFSAPSFVDNQLIFADFGRSGGLLSFEGLIVSLYSLDNIDSGAPQLVYPQPVEDVVTGRVVASGTIEGDTYYVGTSDNHLVAVNWSDGTRVWEEDFITENSIWSRPLLHNDKLYITSLDRNLYAIDPASGQEIWRAGLGGAISGSPVLDEDSESIMVGSFAAEMASINAETGDIEWLSESNDWIWATPALYKDQVVFVDATGSIYALDQASGEILQTKQGLLPGSVTGDPVVHENLLLVVSTEKQDRVESGTLTAIDLDTFEPVWTYATENGGFNSAPAVAGGRIVLAYSDNDSNLQIVTVDPETGDGRAVAMPDA